MKKQDNSNLKEEAQIRFKEWVKTVKNDWQVAELTFKHGSYEWATFSCQQTLEKLFKGIYLLQNIKYPPHTHNLVKLHNLIKPKLKLTKSEKYLKELTKCYIASRYPDERIENREFDKILTKENTIKLFKFTKEVIKWYTQKLKFKI